MSPKTLTLPMFDKKVAHVKRWKMKYDRLKRMYVLKSQSQCYGLKLDWLKELGNLGVLKQSCYIRKGMMLAVKNEGGKHNKVTLITPTPLPLPTHKRFRGLQHHKRKSSTSPFLLWRKAISWEVTMSIRRPSYTLLVTLSLENVPAGAFLTNPLATN